VLGGDGRVGGGEGGGGEGSGEGGKASGSEGAQASSAFGTLPARSGALGHLRLLRAGTR
jgi:hypothetical protein